MQHQTWVIVGVALAAAAVPCEAKTIDAESRITAVTVFPDRAGITRSTSLELSKDPYTVTIGHLSGFIEPDSVSAKGAGEAQVTLYGVRLVTVQLETAQDPKVKELQDAVQDAMREQQQWRNLKQVLEQERTYLASIQAASSQQIGKDLVTKSPSASDAAALLSFLDDSFLKNFERDQNADLALEKLTQRLDKLQRELSELTHGQRRQESSILVELEAQKGGRFQLEVSYRVPGAMWQPSYEARADATAGRVELASSALVRQQTGEAWEDVQLTLSTARPAMSGSMPELQPWFLRPWEPVYPASRTAGMDANAPAAEAVMKMRANDELGRLDTAQELEEAKTAYATVESQGPAVTFRLPRTASIPADWQPHKVPISSMQLTAELAYEATPRLLAYAFLRAKATNTSQTLFLPGPVSVFLDGAFVATAMLKQVAPNETFDLYLGVDERVKVERKPMKERVEVSLLPGLRGKTKSTEYEFLTTIENFTGRRISVTVFDQLPVSEREEIVVESVKQQPPDVTKDEEKPGVFSWALDLTPNQKEELTLAYRIRHPVDMQIQ